MGNLVMHDDMADVDWHVFPFFLGVFMTCCPAFLVTDEIGFVLPTRRSIRLSLAGQLTLQACSIYSGVT